MPSLDDNLLEGYLVTPVPDSHNSNLVFSSKSHAVPHSISDKMLENSASSTVLEYFRSAREEVLQRVKYRDNWLTLQLLAQVVLFALAEGVEIMGVRTPQANPIFLFLSIPISLLLASLYHVEDCIIGYIGNYISAIPAAEAVILARQWTIHNWDSSAQFKLYGEGTLPIRLIAQVIAFLIIPISLSIVRMSSIPKLGLFEEVELFIDVVFSVIVCAILIRGFVLRRKINDTLVSSIITVENNKEKHSTKR